ncbi:MAG: polymerase beta domain protein region [Bacteriovoracaceae bacterium]|nr:polymerase beta domain protein region [Bacteriovoracaceae bacterium]
MDRFQFVKKHREDILKLAALHGANHIRVFGSVARGTAGPNSDIDFLIRLDPGRSLLDHAGFLSDLEDLLKCRVDVVTEKGLRSIYREQVLREAKPL